MAGDIGLRSQAFDNIKHANRTRSMTPAGQPRSTCSARTDLPFGFVAEVVLSCLMSKINLRVFCCPGPNHCPVGKTIYHVPC